MSGLRIGTIEGTCAVPNADVLDMIAMFLHWHRGGPDGAADRGTYNRRAIPRTQM
jgi:hypothetical protein